MWSLIKLIKRSLDCKCWIEVIALGYILLEVELRLMLFAKGYTKEEIDKQKFLLDLANLAKQFMDIEDRNIFDNIKTFNTVRRKAIHRFAQGEIEYGDLEGEAQKIFSLTGKIQSLWIKITIGPEESYREYMERKVDK